MGRIGKPPGLIRLSSQNAVEGGRRRFLRPRVVLYPALILALATAFLVVLFNEKSADVTVLQGLGSPYIETAPGEITSQLQVIIENRSGRDTVYTIEIADEAQAHFARKPGDISIAAGKSVRNVPGNRGPGVSLSAGDLRHSLADLGRRNLQAGSPLPPVGSRAAERKTDPGGVTAISRW